MPKKNNRMVSIVTPVYNAEDFIEETIKSVQDQSYENWEMLLVDDCSTDKSVELIKKLSKTDKRLKLFKNKTNSGAAKSRNVGTTNAKGRYVAFLDADDLWKPEKLKKQLEFMDKKNSLFSYTDYEFADENGKPNGKKVVVPTTINYQQCLKNPIIWTSTVMIDVSRVDKSLLMMPDVKRGQDAATWWQILKQIDSADGLNQILSYYRRTKTSLSANKFKAVERTWYLYRKIEKLNIFKSIWVFCWYIFNAVKKRV